MPCRYDDDCTPEPVEQLTPLLCEAVDLLESLEEQGAAVHMSAELKKWAAKHQAEEMMRTRLHALAKLTPREKRALGLKDR